MQVTGRGTSIFKDLMWKGWYDWNPEPWPWRIMLGCQGLCRGSWCHESDLYQLVMGTIASLTDRHTYCIRILSCCVKPCKLNQAACESLHSLRASLRSLSFTGAFLPWRDLAQVTCKLRHEMRPQAERDDHPFHLKPKRETKIKT